MNLQKARAIGAKIREVRLLLGWRQKDLVERTRAHDPEGKGLNISTIYNWENGYTIPNDNKLMIVCRTLGVSMGYLKGVYHA